MPRWRPKFITALTADDRCHLNGLAVVDGRPQFVTALGETDMPGGWRANKAHGGCLIDVPSGAIVAGGPGVELKLHEVVRSETGVRTPQVVQRPNEET